jgi:hypothetical protein
MSFFFRPNATQRERVFTTMVFAWVALAVYGVISSFGPAEWVSNAATWLALPIAIALWIPLARDRHPSNKLWQSSLLVRAGGLVVAAGALYLFSFMALSNGAPSLITAVWGHSGRERVPVAGKSSGSSQRLECQHSIRLRVTQSKWLCKVCVDQEAWNAIEIGETVEVLVTRSSLGARVDQLLK